MSNKVFLAKVQSFFEHALYTLTTSVLSHSHITVNGPSPDGKRLHYTEFSLPKQHMIYKGHNLLQCPQYFGRGLPGTTVTVEYTYIRIIVHIIRVPGLTTDTPTKV